MSPTRCHKHPQHNELIKLERDIKHACQSGLTNDMLDDHLHRPERHVATRDTVGSTGAPFIRGHSL